MAFLGHAVGRRGHCAIEARSIAARPISTVGLTGERDSTSSRESVGNRQAVPGTRRAHLIARKPSKHTHFMIEVTSVKPARFIRSRLPCVEKGSRMPFKLRALWKIS